MDLRVANYELFGCISEIERVEREIYRLQLYREELLERKKELKESLNEAEAGIRPGNICLKNQMALNLLNGKDIY